jgi:hypothetical protein
MAAPSSYEIYEDSRVVDEYKSWNSGGIIMQAGQVLRQLGGTVMVFVMEENTTSGVTTNKNFACDDASDWTDLYTVPTGYSAYVSVHVCGPSTFSLAITATHVEGEVAEP